MRLKSFKMLFKIGVTVIVLVAIYMYYAIINLHSKENIDESLQLISHKQVDDSQVRLDAGQSKEDSLEIKHVAEDDINENDQKKGEDKKDELTKKDLKSSVDLEEKINVVVPITKMDPIVERSKSKHWREGLHISVVCCGDRVEETLVMFKSAVMFSKSLLVFHIFADDNLQKEFKEQLDFWPPKFRERIDYHIYNITFPPSENGQQDDWKNIFKPCAAQRLFIPTLLTDVDSILYVDTDVIFLSPVDEIWSYFAKFNSTQLAAVTPEHEDKAIGWYNRFARHPYYGELGVNSGVMLMNLTRLRASSWLQSLKNYFKEYRLKIPFGDQDLINIYFHYYPGQLYILSCEWNYRPDHCMYMSICKPAEVTGVYVLHGCRRVWHEDKQPAFKAIYTAFKQHDLQSTIQYDLLVSIKNHMNAANTSNCGTLAPIFTRQIQTYIDSLHKSNNAGHKEDAE